MTEAILQKLLELEQNENIKILYTCESGSRAWGFASPDSDFDVRFTYARPANDYLSITDVPDNVGLPVNEVLDIGGWDIKKALKLFLKSNSTCTNGCNRQQYIRKILLLPMTCVS